MNPPRVRRGFTRGRRLWLCLALSLGLALLAQAAAAKGCARETPLPAEVHLIAPVAEVPEDIARFAGIWSSEAVDERGSICNTLVVEEVLANGYARVIFSIGTSAALHVRLPWFLRATGRVVDEELLVQLPLSPHRLTYRLAGETLQGTHEGGDWRPAHATLTRLADVSQVGCGPPDAGPLPPPSASGPRDRLTAAELLAPDAGHRPAYVRGGLGQVIVGPVHNAYFIPIGQAAPARHALQGTVTVAFSHMFRARHGCTALGTTMPGFTVAFFTQGEHLVPVVRDILQPPDTHIHGTLILSPGRVWSEAGDGGLSRASFPFVLIERPATRNGLATFLYDDTRVSALRFQIVQENVPLGVAKYDGWGQTPLTYSPGPIADEEAVWAQFAAELQQQTRIRPWSALPATAGSPWLDGFDGDTAPDDISVSGVIIDGVIYLRGCETRWGPYPYCRHMRHGVFSVTKSLGAAVALLRLARIYGDEVFDLKIKDFIPVTAAHDGWARVTFGDALNMATGIGDNWPRREPNQPFADENTPKLFRWLEAPTAKAKLTIAFFYDQYPWGPGEVLRYNSTQTFVLTAAMDSFLKRQAGPTADLWDMVVSDVFQPLGIFHAPTLRTQEMGGGRGIPHLAHGLYPTIDDIAKLTTLLQQGGQHQGQQLLSAAKLAEALDTTETRGLPSGQENRFGEGRYHLSFWSVPYRTATGCLFQIPYMMGFGGNLVVLLPNGISAFRFADGHHYDVDTMVLAAEAIRPFPCPAGSAETPPAPQPLSASALRAELPGTTLYADSLNRFPGSLRGHLTMFVSADGMQYSTFKAGPDAGIEHDVGTWYITPDGHFCNTWHAWRGRRERCFAVYREGETLELYPQDRLGKDVFRRVPGNPEGY
jgi:hypothetical protein